MSGLQVNTVDNVNKTVNNQNNSVTNNNVKKGLTEREFSQTEKVIGGLSALALLGAGIYYAVRHGKKPNSVASSGNTSHVLPDSTNPVIEKIEITLKDFKEACNKFVKGKAVNADGTKFNGNITLENGRVLEYKDGVLQQVLDKDAKPLKKYLYDENGYLKKIDNMHVVHDAKTGKLLEFGKKKFYYNKEGLLKYMFTDIEDPIKGFGPRFIEYYSGTNNPKAEYFPKITQVTKYDKNGNRINEFIVCPVQKPLYRRHKDLNNKVILKIRDTDGTLNWRPRMTRSTKNGKFGTAFDDRIIFTKIDDTADLNDYNVSLRKFLNDTGKFEQRILDIRCNGNTLSTQLDGCKTANLCMQGVNSAKYDIKTGEIEVLPESKHTKEEIKAVIDDLLSVGETVKSKIRNFYNYQAELDKYLDLYDKVKNNKLPHFIDK